MDSRKNCLEHAFEKDPEFLAYVKTRYKEEMVLEEEGVSFNRFCNRYFPELEKAYQKKKANEPYQNFKDAYIESLEEADPDFFESFDGFGDDD